MDDIRRDPMTNKSWAIVRNCEHPEWPPLAVIVPETANEAKRAFAGMREVASGVPATTTPVVKAGTAVRLVRVETNLRLEMAGVAQANGMMGDRVRVRVIRPSGVPGDVIGAEQVLVGIVRGNEVLELEQ